MLTKTGIRELLERNGISSVVTTRRLAEALGVCVQTVIIAKNKGILKQCDRNTYELDSIVNWLYGRPRYLVRLAEKQSTQNQTQ